MTDHEAAADVAAFAVRIRPETVADVPAIHALTDAAFAPMPFYDGKEAGCIDAMRAAGELSVSLVAEVAGTIIGHVALSPAWVAGEAGWYGLGPISVRADYQRQGIGGRLAAEAIGRLPADCPGVTLIGNPAVYRSMGFVSNGALTYRDLDPGLVQFLLIAGQEPSGALLFAPAMEAAF